MDHISLMLMMFFSYLGLCSNLLIKEGTLYPSQTNASQVKVQISLRRDRIRQFLVQPLDPKLVLCLNQPFLMRPKLTNRVLSRSCSRLNQCFKISESEDLILLVSFFSFLRNWCSESYIYSLFSADAKAGSSKSQPSSSIEQKDKSTVKVEESKDKSEKAEDQAMDTGVKEPKV